MINSIKNPKYQSSNRRIKVQNCIDIKNKKKIRIHTKLKIKTENKQTKSKLLNHTKLIKKEEERKQINVQKN